MRYKELVIKDIETLESLLNSVKRGMEGSNISVQDVYSKITQLCELSTKIRERISLEHED